MNTAGARTLALSSPPPSTISSPPTDDCVASSRMAWGLATAKDGRAGTTAIGRPIRVVELPLLAGQRPSVPRPRPARQNYTSVCSAISSASSTSIPRYRPCSQVCCGRGEVEPPGDSWFAGRSASAWCGASNAYHRQLNRAQSEPTQTRTIRAYWRVERWGEARSRLGKRKSPPSARPQDPRAPAIPRLLGDFKLHRPLGFLCMTIARAATRLPCVTSWTRSSPDHRIGTCCRWQG